MYGPCRSAVGGGQALTSPSRHRLGKLLPYQQADSPQVNPEAINLYIVLKKHKDYRVLSHLSVDYARLPGMSPRVTTPSAMGLNPFDLHASTAPPAFTLS